MTNQYFGSDPRQVLIRSVNWLGDMVMTLPALHRVRERYPDAKVVVYAPEKMIGFWSFCPSVDRVLTFKRHTGVLSAGRRLRREGFDLALVLPNSPRSALETWLARIPDRVGYARPWRNRFLTKAVSPRPGAVAMLKRSVAEIRGLNATKTSNTAETFGQTVIPAEAHHLYDYLHLAAAVGARGEAVAPELVLKPADLENARQALRYKIPGGEKPSAPALFLGLNPSAAYGPAKKWPLTSFAAAAHAISSRVPNVVWLLFGEKRDHEECQQLGPQLGARFINLAGQTSLRDLVLDLALCKLLLTNDSGPMHVAAAVGTPVAAIFGSTSPRLTGPGLPGNSHHAVFSSEAACSPCFLRTCPIDLRCFQATRPEQVAAAACRLLAPYAL